MERWGIGVLGYRFPAMLSLLDMAFMFCCAWLVPGLSKPTRKPVMIKQMSIVFLEIFLLLKNELVLKTMQKILPL